MLREGVFRWLEPTALYINQLSTIYLLERPGATYQIYTKDRGIILLTLPNSDT
jgi:hypothetical protein